LFYIKFKNSLPFVLTFTTRALRFVWKHTTASADKGYGLRCGSVPQTHLDRNKGRCSVKTHKICAQCARKKNIINPEEKSKSLNKSVTLESSGRGVDIIRINTIYDYDGRVHICMFTAERSPSVRIHVYLYTNIGTCYITTGEICPFFF